MRGVQPGIEALEPRRLLSAGDFNTAFGQGGVVDETQDASRLYINDGMILPGDKILVAGGISPADSPSSEMDYFLRRYNADGSPDNTFGTAGTVHGRIAGIGEYIQSIEPLAGGKFLALAVDETGAGESLPQFPDLLLTRFNADGSPDSSYGNDGLVRISRNTGLFLFAAQSDGSALVAQDDDLTRYTAAGQLDTAFGTGGTAHALLGGNIRVITPLANGSILVGGSGAESQGFTPFAFAKLKTNGTLDTSFGQQGKVTTSIPHASNDFFQTLSDLDVLSDGTLIASGQTFNGTTFAMAFHPDGAVDTSFGVGGAQTFESNSSPGLTQIDAQDRIYLSDAGGAVTRLTSDGQFDDFGTVIGGQQNVGGFLAGIESNGTLVVAGMRSLGGSAPENVLFGFRTADDGKLSPVSISNGIVTIAGTSSDDWIYGQDTPRMLAIVNEFGRFFNDATQAVVNAGDGDDFVTMINLWTTPCSVSGGNGRDTIGGGDQNDTLEGNASRDFIDGGKGNDQVIGNGGNDQLRGEAGNDTVRGCAGNDHAQGNDGNDTVHGGRGLDTLDGGGGNDIFVANDLQVDHLFAGPGQDTAIADGDDLLDDVELAI